MHGASGQPWIECSDPAQLADRAAEWITCIAHVSIAARGRFTIALAGGSTPKATYQRLAAATAGSQIDWSRTFLFFGDERHVPHDDPRSNYQMAHESLLTAPMPASRCLPCRRSCPPRPNVRTRTREPCSSSSANRGTDAGVRPDSAGAGRRRAHGRLFPHAAALDVHDTPATWSPPGVLPPPVDRITLTFPVLNAASRCCFWSPARTRPSRWPTCSRDNAAAHERPAAGVRPDARTLTWLVDQAAARTASPRLGMRCAMQHHRTHRRRAERAHVRRAA